MIWMLRDAREAQVDVRTYLNPAAYYIPMSYRHCADVIRVGMYLPDGPPDQLMREFRGYCCTQAAKILLDEVAKRYPNAFMIEFDEQDVRVYVEQDMRSAGHRIEITIRIKLVLD